MISVPIQVSITFLACVLTVLVFLYFSIKMAAGKSSNKPIMAITFITTWLFIISLLAASDFFTVFGVLPPRLVFAIIPSVMLIIALLLIPGSRDFLMKIPITALTYIHIVRVPVEIVLWWLFTHGLVAKAMTFEGYNYDILSGISAPFAGLFLVGMRSKSKIGAIIWNILALLLLINIVVTSVLASPDFFDPARFDQPNMAVFHSPYILLPAFIVPAVFFAHVVSLVQLFSKKESEL